MDQQFQQYEQFFKNLFQKVKEVVLRQKGHKIRWQIAVFCGYFIVFKGIDIFNSAQSYISYHSYLEDEDSSFILVMLLEPLIPFVGALLMLFRKRLGWYILFTYILINALLNLWGLTYESAWTTTIGGSSLIDLLDEMMIQKAEDLIKSALLFIGMIIFMGRSSFREVYKVRKESLWIPMVIAIAIVVTEYFLGLI